MRALAFALVMLAARSAWPCDGDSDSDSDDGSDGDSSSDEGGAAEPACVETSRIVGRSECSRFGAWDAGRLPRLQLAVGSGGHAFSTSGLTFRGSAEHDSTVAYRLRMPEGDEGGRGSAITLDLRGTVLLGGGLFVGVEGDLGLASLPGPSRDGGGPMAIEPGATFYLAGGALAGVVVPVSDALLVRAEALAGHRLLALSVTTREVDCVDQSTAFAHTWMVQPRLAVETWLLPTVSLGAWMGADALHRGDRSAGVYLQAHSRAFSGLRGR